MKDIFKLIESKTTVGLFGEETLVFPNENEANRAMDLAESAGIWSFVNHKDDTGCYVSVDSMKNLKKWSKICNEAGIRHADINNAAKILVHEATLKVSNAAERFVSECFVNASRKGQYLKVSGTQTEIQMFESKLRDSKIDYSVISETSYEPLPVMETDCESDEMAELKARDPKLYKAVMKTLGKGDDSDKTVLRDKTEEVDEFIDVETLDKEMKNKEKEGDVDPSVFFDKKKKTKESVEIDEATDDNNINKPRGETTQYGTYASEQDVDMEVKAEKSVEKQTKDDNNKGIDQTEPEGTNNGDMFDAMVGFNSDLDLEAPDEKPNLEPLNINTDGSQSPVANSRDAEDMADMNAAVDAAGEGSTSDESSEDESKKTPSTFKPEKNADGSDFDGVEKARDEDNGVEKPKEKKETDESETQPKTDDDSDGDKKPAFLKKKKKEGEDVKENAKKEMAVKLEQQLRDTKRKVSEQRKISLIAEGLEGRDWSSYTMSDLKREIADLEKIMEKALGKNKNLIETAIHKARSVK